MHCCRINKLREVLFAMTCSLCSHSTSSLFAELTQRCALDISHVTHCDYHWIIWIEVFRIELFAWIFDFCTALITVFFFYLVEFILHHLLAKFWVIKNLLQVSNLAFQLFILCMQLVHTQSGQLTQTHIYNGFTLQLVKIKALFQVALCIGRSLTCSNNVYNLIDVITSYD